VEVVKGGAYTAQMIKTPAGFAVLYRWKVHPSREHAFIEAWSTATLAYRSIGALGSRLHRAENGDLLAYAEWPSREAWENANACAPIDAGTATTMRQATLEFEATLLEISVDLLVRSK
jgi:hypothetical protein